MDSVRSILPNEGIRIYGAHRGGHEQVEATHKSLARLTILDEQITFRGEDKELGIRWLAGAHPHLGEIISGKNGYETIQRFSRVL